MIIRNKSSLEDKLAKGCEPRMDITGRRKEI